MRIYIAKYEPDRQGGGWTFQRNLANGLSEFISDYDNSDIYLISSASIVQRDEVIRAKEDGKKIVLRLDNAIRNSRNRNTGMSRMRDFCELSDLVIYQSEWAREFLLPFTKTAGEVILNGVDTSYFNSNDRSAPEGSYLYVRSSRDEGKQWIMAWYYFVNNPGYLEIVGKFSTDNLAYNFDFFNQEVYSFAGHIPDLRPVYKRNRYFLYTYLNDACSNTLLEARASGCEIIDVYGMLKTGGAPEIMACNDISLERMCKQYLGAMESL